MMKIAIVRSGFSIRAITDMLTPISAPPLRPCTSRRLPSTSGSITLTEIRSARIITASRTQETGRQRSRRTKNSTTNPPMAVPTMFTEKIQPAV